MTDDMKLTIRIARDHAVTLRDTVGMAIYEVCNEVERLHNLICDASEVLTSYGDGGVVYPDEQEILDALRKEL